LAHSKKLRLQSAGIYEMRRQRVLILASDFFMSTLPMQIHKNSLGRLATLVLAYSGVFWLSRILAFELRFDFVVPQEWVGEQKWGWLKDLPLRFLFLFVFGQFTGLLSYFSIPDFRRLVLANGLALGLVLSAYYLQSCIRVAPRGVLLTDFLLSTAGLTAVRLSIRMFRERYAWAENGGKKLARRVGIIGAGDVGANLARELLARRGMGLRPVAFFDDDQSKWHSLVHGVPVQGGPEMLKGSPLHPRIDQIDEVIIAMPSASAKRRGEIVKLLQEAGLPFKTVPSLDQLTTGKVKVSQLRSVEIQDLLMRDAVQLETEEIRKILKGKVVMVTGAGGSIGSELCRQIAAFNPTRLLLLDQSEVQLFPIEQELIEIGYGGIVLPIIGDILDKVRIECIFENFKPQVVFHAAAHKHVPLMEGQPSEAIKNNTFGTALMVDLSVDHGVERFVMISTDKAINPTNVMGASKRLAEIYLQAKVADNGIKTRFMAVRFGNVLGSSGSVIPTFKHQIAAGGPVKVTHPDVMRYFMTIPEAVGLVLQSGALGEGGEIFVLDMGDPVKIVDLARQLIELSGLRPDDDIEIQFVGLRPGEKLFEEISHKGENMEATGHPKIMRFVCEPARLDEVKAFFNKIEPVLYSTGRNQLKMMIQEAVPEYSPYLS
jgi:FlaA1/EpsC-like NDP-sugar epimerase